MVSRTAVPEMATTIGLLRSESARLADFLAGLDGEGWARQSACTEWTVADAAAHLTHGSDGSALALTRARNGDPSPPEGQRLLDAGERASELTAARAKAYRGDKEAADLLQAFASGVDRLIQTAQELTSEDWVKPSFHRRGVIPVHENVTRRIQETAIHGWDIRSAFDPAAELTEEAAVVITNVAHSWLNACFVPLSSNESARFRFEVSGAASLSEDVALEGAGFRIESAGNEPADVTFRSNASAYVLLIYGRLDISSGSTPAQLEIDGPLDKALLFTESFRGF